MTAPHITPAAVLAAVEAGDRSLLQLAETFDVEPSCFTLRRIVNELGAEGRVRLPRDVAGRDDYEIGFAA